MNFYSFLLTFDMISFISLISIDSLNVGDDVWVNVDEECVTEKENYPISVWRFIGGNLLVELVDCLSDVEWGVAASNCLTFHLFLIELPCPALPCCSVQFQHGAQVLILLPASLLFMRFCSIT